MTGHPSKGEYRETTMKASLTVLVVLSLLATPVLANAATAAKAKAAPAAKATYCTDKVTHKRISCKVTAPMTGAKPAPAMMAGAKPAMAAKPAMSAKPATSAKSGMSKTAMAKSKTKTDSKKCGNSYIAADKVCHK